MISKIKNFILLFFIVIVYIIFVEKLFESIGVDADRANHLLQVADIMSGNVLLNDWDLTGITFYTTDLVYYEIAFLFFGLDCKSIFLAGALMVASIVGISSIIAIRSLNKNYKEVGIVLIIVLLFAPYSKMLTTARVHGGAVFLSLLLFILCDCFLKCESRKKNSIYIILMSATIFCGSFGDMLFIIEGAAPVLVLCIYNFLYSEESSRYKKVFVITIISIIISIFADKLFFFIGTANKNSYIGEQLFTPVELWGGKLNLFIRDLLQISYSDFWGHPVFDIFNLPKGIYFLIILIGCVVSIKTLYLIFVRKDKKVDEMTFMLIVGSSFSFLAYLLTDISEQRYIFLIPISIFLIFIKNVELLFIDVNNRKLMRVIIYILLSFCFLSKMRDAFLDIQKQPSNELHEVIDYLEDNNLNCGYASFWNSSNVTVLSNGDVRVRHIIYEEDSFQKYAWFNKNNWYDEEAYFILINKNEDSINSGGIEGSEVINYFGTPDDIYETSNYIVYIYSKNLSSLLGISTSVINDGVISSDECVFNNNCYLVEGEGVVLQNGGMIYGPYEELEAGKYNIIFYGDNLENAYVDIWSNTMNTMNDKTYIYNETYRDINEIILSLEIFENIPDIEIRVINNMEESMMIKTILINDYGFENVLLNENDYPF